MAAPTKHQHKRVAGEGAMSGKRGGGVYDEQKPWGPMNFQSDVKSMSLHVTTRPYLVLQFFD
jgi:hypothetical protein